MNTTEWGELAQEGWSMSGADRVAGIESKRDEFLRLTGARTEPGCTGVAGAPGRPSAPCQYIHNCPDPQNQTIAEEIEGLLAKARTVGGSHKKTAFALKENVGGLVRGAGVENSVFFTPTLANQNGSAPDPARAQSCWRKMEKMIALEFPGGGVRILERGGKRGRLHYHVLLDVGKDVRTGYNFEASRVAQAANRRARWELHESANPALRSVYRRLYRLARNAGFGEIFHCEPVRSEVEAIKVYLAKYICKHVGQRLLIDKGRRLVGYFGKGTERRELPAASRFAFGGPLKMWGGPNAGMIPNYRNGWAWLFRKKTECWALSRGLENEDQAKSVLGSHWRYRNRDAIRQHPLTSYPHWYMFEMDLCGSARFVRDVMAIPPLHGPVTVELHADGIVHSTIYLGSRSTLPDGHRGKLTADSPAIP